MDDRNDPHEDGLTIGQIVRAGVGLLADLVRRIVNGIAGLAPIVAVGCTGPKVEPKADAAPKVVEPRAVEKTVSDEPTPLGRFDITFYYVIGEEEVMSKLATQKPANDETSSELAAVQPAVETVTLYEPKTCSPIADVSRQFAQQLRLQGTGKLKDGRVLNIWGACPCDRQPCYKVLKTNRWGTAGTGRPLQPFRTVAVDPGVIKLGSLVYVPLLEGRTMPGRPPWGGFVHDGCLVADDTGGGIKGKQLDLFVGRRAYYHGLSGSGGSHAWSRHIPVYDGSKICQRQGRKIGRKTASI